MVTRQESGGLVVTVRGCGIIEVENAATGEETEDLVQTKFVCVGELGESGNRFRA